MFNRYLDVLKSLSARRAKYVVIGGVAAIAHGVPRNTLDLDILIEPTVANARRVLQAFIDAGLATAELTTAEAVAATEITIFKDRVRVDVQTLTPGLEFHRAWTNRLTIMHHGQRVHLVSLDDLISSKRAAGREIDLEDVRILQLMKKK